MQLNTLKFGLLAAALTVGSTAFAQGSDACATAQVLPGDGTHAFDNNGATTGAEGQACTTINSDVWFEWTASVSGTATLSTCSGTTLDTKVAAYDATLGCVVGALCLNSNDDSCGLQSEIDFAVTSGSTYLLQVGSFSTITQGSGTFNIFVTPPVCSGPDDDLTTGDNDTCATALALPLGFNSGFQVLGAANAGGVDDDFWSVTLAPNDRLDVTVAFDGAIGNIDIALFDVTTVACPGTFLVASAVNPSNSEVISYTNTGAAAANLVLWIQANGVLFDCNDYSMDVAVTPALTNDDCATPAVATTGVNSFDNVTATTGAEGQACTTINSDVWYSWVADFTGTAFVNTCGGTTLDTKLAAYDPSSACVVGALCLDSNDDACGLQSEITFAVTLGNTYIIQVGSFSTVTQGSGTFEIGEVVPCTIDSFEDNDSCATAVAAPGGLTTGLTITGPGDPAGEDLDFYSITVADGETLTVNIFFIDADGDTDLFLYDAADPGCGSGLGGTNLAQSISVTDDETVTWTNSTGAAVNVIIGVDVFGSTFGCQTYDLEVTGGSSALGTPFCFGDGSDGVICPCGNIPPLGSGEHCTHSTTVGAFLTATGSPTVGADTLTLTINQGEPGEAAIFISNTGNAGAGGTPFGIYDGAICVTVDAFLTRHFTNPATGVPIPTIMDGTGTGTNVIPLSDSDFNGLTVPGATIYYQAWMRSPAGPCGGLATFSAGLSILWN